MSARADDEEMGLGSAADALPVVDEEPLGPLGNRLRADYQAELCRLTDIAGMLHVIVSMAPDNEESIDHLGAAFNAAAIRAAMALDRFRAARHCAGEA